MCVITYVFASRQHNNVALTVPINRFVCLNSENKFSHYIIYIYMSRTLEFLLHSTERALNFDSRCSGGQHIAGFIFSR